MRLEVNHIYSAVNGDCLLIINIEPHSDSSNKYPVVVFNAAFSATYRYTIEGKLLIGQTTPLDIQMEVLS